MFGKVGKHQKNDPTKRKPEKLIVHVSQRCMLTNSDGNISVTYISAHTGHDLGPQELKFLPLPQSTKEAVSMKISQGIPTERILKGYLTCSS